MKIAPRPPSGPAVASLLLTFALGVSSASAEVAALESARDNTLIETTDGALSNGAGPVFHVGRTGQKEGGLRRGVVGFDLSPLPEGAIVSSATVTLHLSASPGSGSTTIGLHRALADWGEGSSETTGGTGAPSQPGDATWLHTFYPTDTWSLEGGDFEPTASAAALVGDTPGELPEWSSDALRDDVQQWLDDPASDFGWVLVGDETVPSTVRRFDSREHAEQAQRPLLTVEFVPSTPSGGSAERLAALALASGAHLLRRRRTASASPT